MTFSSVISEAMSSLASFLIIPWPTTVTILVLITLLIGTGIRRVYFSPLSHFPGPKLAALTKLYEIYYDVWLDGKFTL